MRVEELEREIKAERLEPDHEFARRLDEWAAAGFPRGGALDPRSGERLAATPPRRLLAPVGAAATLFVVAGVAISQSGGLGQDGEDTPGPAALSSGEEPGERRAEGESFAVGPPAAAEGPARSAELDVGATEDSTLPAPDGVVAPLPPPGGSGGGIARGTEKRIVDATARVLLAADADEVQEVANGVVEVTDRYEGVVLDSQVTTDQAGARAVFELEIPFKRLDAALGDLSGLADVISRTEQGEDITARAVRARKQLAGVFDRIREARIELIQADTREERLIIKSEISSLQASADALEAELGNVKRQGRFATVGVEITSNGPDTDEGGWNLGDALEDAGRVLEVIAGIALVSLAVLTPLALLAAIAWVVLSRMRAQSRERVLDS